MVPGFDDLRGLPDSLGFLFLSAYDPFGVLVLPVRLGSFFGSTFESYGTPVAVSAPFWCFFVSARTNKRHHYHASPDSDIPKNVPFT
jgi:hypothetical protein